jgi:hypothetical protein
MDAATSSKASEQIRSNSGWVTALGGVMMILGLLAMRSPLVTGIAIAWMVGFLVLFGGVTRIVFAFRAQNWGLGILCILLGGLGILVAPLAYAQHPAEESHETGAPPHTHSLATIGAKLNDPTSDLWALQFEFDMNVTRGRLSENDYKYGGGMEFQPVMPFEWSDNWKLLTRPVIPIVFSTDVPSPSATGGIDFDSKGGIGDIVLPLFFSPKPTSRLGTGKKFSWALGPTWSFPSASSDSLGSGKWEVGPVALALYKDKRNTAGVFAQYWWSFAGDGDRNDTSHASIQYFYYRMFGAWQIGTNPIITFDNEADSDNKWNLPIGITIGKTIKVGKVPMKIQVGLDYSVVHQRDFGEVWKAKLTITPVIPSLMTRPLTKLVQR